MPISKTGQILNPGAIFYVTLVDYHQALLHSKSMSPYINFDVPKNIFKVHIVKFYF